MAVRHAPHDLAHVTDRGISITRRKTGAELLLPVHSEPQVGLHKAREDRTGLVALTPSFGEILTFCRFSQWMHDEIATLACRFPGSPTACERLLADTWRALG